MTDQTDRPPAPSPDSQLLVTDGARAAGGLPEVIDAVDGGAFAAEPAAGATSGNEFSWLMLSRAKWLILGVFLLVSAVVIPCVWLSVRPVYRATAVVQVSARVPRIVFRTEDNGVVPLYRSYLNTQVSKIRSPRGLKRVLERPAVGDTQWYKQRPRTLRTLLGGMPLTHVERLRGALTVRPRRDTELIDVSIVAPSARDAKLIVDAVVDEYRQLTVEEIMEHDKLVFDKLRRERANLQKEIDGLVELKGNLSKIVGTDDPDIVRSQLALQLGTLRSEREQLERAHHMTLWELGVTGEPKEEGGAVQSQTGEDGVYEASEPRYSDDAEWRMLGRQLEAARHDLELGRQQYGESHPQIGKLVSGLSYAEGLLREREVQLVAQWGGGRVRAAVPGDAAGAFANRPVDLERLADRQSWELQLLDRQIDDLQAEQQQKGELAKQLAKYDQQLVHKSEVYKAVIDRLTALEMEEMAPGRVSVAHHALSPSQPDRDRRFLLTALALGGAMMAGLAVGYIRVSMDTKIREAGDVADAVRVPFLGQLPPLPETKDLMANCGPLIMESVRMVRTALLERLDKSRKNVVVITSSTSQAGKTSVAILLARSLAVMGKKTLLVEADLRRPTLSGRLKIKSKVGLTTVLTGAANDTEAIMTAGIGSFDVLVAGEPPVEFDPELLANGVWAVCLERWKESYDYVLVDSPPVLPVADARILAGQADGTLMVLRSAHCRRMEVTQAYADVCAAGGTLLGTVLIGGRQSAGYGYGYYGDYYGRGAPVHALQS